MTNKKVFNNLEELGKLIPAEDREELDKKAEYQEKWRDNKFKFREMVAQKNRSWLKKNAKLADFDYYDEFPEVYNKIAEYFDNPSKRKFMIHIVTEFLPLSKSCKVPQLRGGKDTCLFTGFGLTDMKSIFTGDRDKHIAFTGENTNIVLSGVAIQELERYVMDCTDEFNSQIGQIVNHALDQKRCKDQNLSQSKKPKKTNPTKGHKTP